MVSERSYLLGPRERKGLVAGWRVGQVVMVGFGCGLAMASVVVSSATPGIVVAIAAIVLSLALAAIPLRGRTVDEWIPAVLRYWRGRGEGVIGSFTLVSADRYGGSAEIGVIEEKAGTQSVVLLIESTGISLLGPEEKDQRVDGLVTAVATMAREGSVIDRASWTMWSNDAASDSLFRDLRLRGVEGVESAKESYRSLLTLVSSHGVLRQVALTLRSQRGARRSGGSCLALLEEASTIAQALKDAGHQRVELASTGIIEDLFRDRFGFEPDDVKSERTLSISGLQRFGHLESRLGAATSWWIAEWPRHEVTAELLAPLMLSDPHRCVSVVVQPVAPSVALRRAQSAKTTGAADDELRRRGGFLLDRRREREADHLLAREAELVDGHGSIRMAGFVSVVGDDAASLQAQIVETELCAAQAHLVLQRLQGDHGRGYLATLPLAGGLP